MSDSKNSYSGDTGKPTSVIPRSKLAHQIVSRVREAIVKGKWAPGESLPTHVVAQEFGVSHIPIREAFLVLESEGFISLAPNRKAIVTEPSIEETRDKLILLHTLEALAAELAASQASKSDLADIKRLQAKLETAFKAKDLRGYHLTNLEFHRRIVLAAKNRTLADFHQILTSHLEWARVRSHIRQDLLPDSPRQHQSIVDSLVRGDAAAARAAMEQHSRSFGSALLHGVEEHVPRNTK